MWGRWGAMRPRETHCATARVTVHTTRKPPPRICQSSLAAPKSVKIGPFDARPPDIKIVWAQVSVMAGALLYGSPEPTASIVSPYSFVYGRWS